MKTVCAVVVLCLALSTAQAEQVVTHKDVALYLSSKGVNRGTVFTPDNGAHHFIIKSVSSGATKAGDFDLRIRIQQLPVR